MKKTNNNSDNTANTRLIIRSKSDGEEISYNVRVAKEVAERYAKIKEKHPKME